jgi:hypothetical protein
MPVLSPQDAGQTAVAADSFARGRLHLLGLVACVVIGAGAVSASAQRLPPGKSTIRRFTYPSSVSSDAEGPLDLQAAVTYPTALSPGERAPLAVIMHGFSPATGNIRDEAITPLVNSSSYLEQARVAESFPGEFANVRLHIGKSDNSLWLDRDGNGNPESAEIQNWPHGLSADIQARGEAWYLDRLLAGEVPPPEIATTDEFTVAGWVRTKAFQLWLGDGQNAAAKLRYVLGEREAEFEVEILTSDKDVEGVLTLYGERLPAGPVRVEINGLFQGIQEVSTGATFEGVRHGDLVRLTAVPEPATWCLAGLAFCGTRGTAGRRGVASRRSLRPIAKPGPGTRR